MFKLDDLDSMDFDLKEIEDKFSTNEEILEKLSEPSAADYWRRRLEEEKVLFNKTIETKEQEKKALQIKLDQTLNEINTLQEQIKQLEKTFTDQSQSWQERLKVRETELLLQKERVDWINKLKDLEYKNKVLTEEIDRIKKIHEQELQTIKISYKKHFEELLTEQNSLIENFELIERELKIIEESHKKEKQELEVKNVELNKTLETKLSEINSLQNKLTKVEKENATMLERIDTISNEAIKERDDYKQHVQNIINNFISKLKDYIGTITGINNFCLNRTKISRIAQKQLVIINNIIENIYDIIDKFKI